MKKFWPMLFCILSLLTAEPMEQRTRILMGTYVTVTLPSGHNREISHTFKLLKDIEGSLSTFDRNASLYRLNHTHRISYDACLAEALERSKVYYEKTQGYFDVTIGSISKKLYHFGEARTYSPSKVQLEKAPLNIDGIHISKKYIMTDTDITVDLGGMGKGYGADKAAAYLLEQNISRGIIALSGDIRCLGPCKVYLQSPFSEQTFARTEARVPDLSVSTSGTYRRYAAKKSEHHLIDPKTAEQEKTFVSVSLFSRADNSTIDAYATAVAVMPKKKALAFLKSHQQIGYVLVETDGTVIYGNLEPFIYIKWRKKPAGFAIPTTIHKP
ncbi:FAD:protein FMN transferase [Sulfurovum sp.]|uniref:FAD:protein FMN transferase n=1 Tax=Sulfurovum sp. TaxID=1969726 RepID=UPI0025F65EEA|nr:FAD:protein FMN transferase [Sulfurovum sp.]